MKWSESDWLLLLQCHEIAPSSKEAAELAMRKLGRTRNAIELKIRAKANLSQTEFYSQVRSKRAIPQSPPKAKKIPQEKKLTEEPSKRMKNALCIPDSHIPYECLKSYGLMLETAKMLDDKYGLDEIVIGGDWADYYAQSFHKKNPNFGTPKDLWEREKECLFKRRDELNRLFPKAKKKYLEGNHEVRAKRHCIEFSPHREKETLNVFEMLELHNDPMWKFYPFHHLQYCQVLDSTLFASHCSPVGGSAENVAKQAGDPLIYFHTHQMTYAEWVTKVRGRIVRAINGGCLVDMDAEPMKYVKSRPKWTLGWTFIHSYGGDNWDFTQVRVQKDYSCMFGGKRFVAPKS